MNRIAFRLKLSCALMALAGASLARGEVLDVPSEYATIRAAIEAAQPGDEIVLAPGTYSGPDNRALNTAGKAITIRSADGPETCVIDCKDEGRAFDIVSGEGPDTVIDGLTIRNGRAERGGAILCQDSSPIIRNCVFEGNAAFRFAISVVTGGAIVVNGGAPRIEDCIFVANRGKFGGAIGASSAELVIRRCVFRTHDFDPPETTKGGAIGLVQDAGASAVVVEDSTFVLNRANSGGAISSESGSLQVARCYFAQNSLSYSGGSGGTISLSGTEFRLDESFFQDSPGETISMLNGNARIRQSTFERCQNTLNGSGGGTTLVAQCRFSGSGSVINARLGHVFRVTSCVVNHVSTWQAFTAIASGGINLANCTVVNIVPYLGQSGVVYAPRGGFLARNSIFWGNSALLRDDWLQQHDIRNCIVQGGFPGENFDIDPRLYDLIGPDGIAGTSDDDLRPIPGGPAVDHGNGSFVPRDLADIDNDGDTIERLPIDLAGRPRISDDPFSADGPFGSPPNVDIGAFEVNRPCEIVGDNDADGDVDLTDLCVTLHHYGTLTGRILGDGDLDQNGDVDLADLAGLLSNFGLGCD